MEERGKIFETDVPLMDECPNVGGEVKNDAEFSGDKDLC
jgi:hypothetical protein